MAAFPRVLATQALTNVARHSGATKVKVWLDIHDGHLLLSIKDNGIGISKERLSDVTSFGLTGMRERILRIGGHFQIEALKEGGTRVRVRVPLAAKT